MATDRIARMRRERASGTSYSEIAAKHGVSRQRVLQLLGPDGKRGRPLHIACLLDDMAAHVGGRGALARLLGVAPNTLTRWIRGNRAMSEKDARDMALLALGHGFKVPYPLDEMSRHMGGRAALDQAVHAALARLLGLTPDAITSRVTAHGLLSEDPSSVIALNGKAIIPLQSRVTRLLGRLAIIIVAMERGFPLPSIWLPAPRRGHRSAIVKRN